MSITIIMAFAWRSSIFVFGYKPFTAVIIRDELQRRVNRRAVIAIMAMMRHRSQIVIFVTAMMLCV